MIYFNEIEPFAAAWLKNLFPDSSVDTRSITDVRRYDVNGFDRCHFFGGIGGWELALQLAGWPADRPVWTGSCPCQPYSGAGKGEGDADPRNLWPQLFRLIRECRPVTVFGEQVASAVRHGWLDGISTDLEGEGYAVGSIVLGAHSAGAPHIRQRIFWVADANKDRFTASSKRRLPDGQHHVEPCGSVGGLELADSDGRSGARVPNGRPGEASGASEACGMADAVRGGFGPWARLRAERHGGAELSPNDDSVVRGMDNALLDGRQAWRRDNRSDDGIVTPANGGDDGMGDAGGEGLPLSEQGELCGPGRSLEGRAACESSGSFWTDFDVIPCRDGKSRRVESGSFPLAYGIPKQLGPLFAVLQRMGLDPKRARRIVRYYGSRLASASRNRVGRLRGYGNAIVPEVAAAFVRAFLESEVQPC